MKSQTIKFTRKQTYKPTDAMSRFSTSTSAVMAAGYCRYDALRLKQSSGTYRYLQLNSVKSTFTF